MLLKIHYYGDPVLRKKCAPIAEITDNIRQLAQDMIETMDKCEGIGLAAPQVGHPIRMFVLRNYVYQEDGKWILSEPKVYINPKLSLPGAQQVADTEGCLSIPGLKVQVPRPDRITVEAMDLNGETFIEDVEGYNARVRMHENDHINGVLMIDRIDPAERKHIQSVLKDIKKKFKS